MVEKVLRDHNAVSYTHLDVYKRQALESGEGAPDVVDIELGKFPAFMTGDIGLKPLNDAVEPYLDNVVESRLQLYSKDGNYYGFPTHVGTTVAFYNTEAVSYTHLSAGESGVRCFLRAALSGDA